MLVMKIGNDAEKEKNNLNERAIRKENASRGERQVWRDGRNSRKDCLGFVWR